MAERSGNKVQGSAPTKYSSGGAAPPSKTANNGQSDTLMYPALHLYPLNDTFVPKQINLAPAGPKNRIKIGRYSNNKTVPSPLNGYFDSKVLSRAHAEVWCENDKVFIKDIKSSNGTFINGTRLSPESQESEPFELHSEDVVDFGIDILTDDNKDVLHRRVACRIYLVITPEDALKLRSDFSSLYRGGIHGGSFGSNGLCPGAEGGFRLGKPNVNLDHIVIRLQGELQKGKMIGTELQALSSTVQNIHETLGGGVAPAQDAPFPELVPKPMSSKAIVSASEQPALFDAPSLAGFESQLERTHAELASHMDKIKSLESTLAAYNNIKGEVAALKEELNQTKQGLSTSQNSISMVKPHDTESQLPEHVREATSGFDYAISDMTTDTLKARDTDFSETDADTTESMPLFQPGMDSANITITKSELASLLARIETLEQDNRTMKSDMAVASNRSDMSNFDITALLGRIERLESATQLQQQLEPPTSPDINDPSLAEWRATFEQRWKEQSLDWEAAQQKINDVIGSWGDPTTPRVLTFGGPLDENENEDDNKVSHWSDRFVDPTYQALGIMVIMLGLALPTVLIFTALKYLLFY